MTDEVAFFAVPDSAEPATRALIEALNEAKAPPPYSLPPEELREFYRQMPERYGFEPVPVGAAEDIEIPGEGRRLPARLYRPAAAASQPPLLLYFHGGGFVIGDLETHDPLCRRICRDAAALVLAVDYRLAPEHAFPAAPEDALAAFQWLAPEARALGADPARLWVGGDSAGGNLAAGLTRRLAAEPSAAPLPAPAGQILIYPVLDWLGTYGSRETLTDTYPLTRQMLDYFDERYFAGPEAEASPLASVSHWPVAGRPAPALILSAELDPLRDEAAAYAETLAVAGVEVRYHCFHGTIHGFMDHGRQLPAAEEALALIAATLRGAEPLGRSGRSRS